MEKEHSDRAREEQQHQLEMEDRKEQFAASEHNRRIKELEADQQFHAEKTQKSSMESTHVIETHQAMKGPKLPPFDEAKDNIDAYIFSGSKDILLRRTEFASTGDHILVHFGCFC